MLETKNKQKRFLVSELAIMLQQIKLARIKLQQKISLNLTQNVSKSDEFHTFTRGPTKAVRTTTFESVLGFRTNSTIMTWLRKTVAVMFCKKDQMSKTRSLSSWMILALIRKMFLSIVHSTRVLCLLRFVHRSRVKSSALTN